MAEFWLPVESDSPGKIEVRGIGRALGISRHDAFGRLLQVWFWFNAESETGIIIGGTCSDIDSVAELPGFAQAMVDVGWLKLSDEGIEQPGFHEHRQVSQKELRKRGRAQKSKSKSALLESLAGTAADRGELVSWLREAFPELAGPQAPQAQPSCATGAATRTRTRTEKTTPEHKPAGRPDLSGSAEAGVPDWPELVGFTGLIVAAEPPPDGYFDTGSAFGKLKLQDLKNPKAVAVWHRRQLSLRDPPVGPTVAHLLLLLATAAAVTTGRTVRNPAALFVTLVSRGEWNCERSLPAVVARWRRSVETGLVDSTTNWLLGETVSPDANVANALQKLQPIR